MKKTALGLLIACVTAFAQTHKVAGPSLGLVVAGGGVQPILGMAGAARLAPVIPVTGASNIAVAPAGRYLLSEQDGQISAGTLSDDRDAVSLSQINGILAQSPEIIFSRSGSSAAIYSAELNIVQVITGLPGTPQVNSKFDVTTPLDHIAVTDDGQTVLAHDSNGSLIDLSSGQSVYKTASIGAIALSPGSHNGLLYDSSAHAFFAISGDSVSKMNVSEPAATAETLIFSSDGRTAMAGSTLSHTVWSIDMISGKATAFAAEDGVKKFSLLSPRDTFLMEYAGGTYGIASWRNGRLSISFVGIVRNDGVQ